MTKYYCSFLKVKKNLGQFNNFCATLLNLITAWIQIDPMASLWDYGVQKWHQYQPAANSKYAFSLDPMYLSFAKKTKLNWTELLSFRSLSSNLRPLQFIYLKVKNPGHSKQISTWLDGAKDTVAKPEQAKVVKMLHMNFRCGLSSPVLYKMIMNWCCRAHLYIHV